jgi:hypothetical protein
MWGIKHDKHPKQKQKLAQRDHDHQKLKSNQKIRNTNGNKQKNNQKMRKANGRKQKIANNDPETAKKYQST